MPYLIKEYSDVLRRNGGSVSSEAMADLLRDIDTTVGVIESERDDAIALLCECRDHLVDVLASEGPLVVRVTEFLRKAKG